ncbi:MAG: T9SS type A sorting domain-containing protein [Saprospiraceae bacterium]
MKKLLTLPFLFLPFLSNGQYCCPVIYKMEILPAIPNDSVVTKLFKITGTFRLSEIYSQDVYQSADTIYVEECYIMFPLDKSDVYYDTVSLGKLDPGTYVLNYQGIVADTFSICREDFRNDSIFTFEVKKYSNVPIVEDLEKFKIYPNPSADRVLQIQSAEKLDAIEIFDLNGNLVKTLNENQSIGSTINLEGLSRGLFLVKVETVKGHFYLQRLALF